MSEKRGYPNPDFTEEDVLSSEPMELKAEMILDDQLIEYIQKSALYDCLAAAVKLTGEVNEDLVKAITGNLQQEELVPKKDADSYWNLYVQEVSATKILKERIASLERDNKGLKEILRQNKVGPYADQPEQNAEEDA